MTRSLFGGIFNGIAMFLGFVWLTIAGGTTWAIYYIANNSKPVVWIAFFAGFGACLLVVLMVTLIMVASNAARDIAETKRFAADQKSDSEGQRLLMQQMLGMQQFGTAQLNQELKRRNLDRADLAFQQQLEASEPPPDPITIEGGGDLF